jgi:tight adherence protein B
MTIPDMNPGELFIIAGAACVAALATVGAGLWLISRSERSSRLDHLNQRLPGNPQPRESVRPIFVEDIEKSLGSFGALPPIRALQVRLESAGMDWSVYTFLSNIFAMLCLGLFLGLLLPIAGARVPSMIVYALLASTAPWVVMEYKRSQRIRTLEQQLPEAVDFIARAIRAGHALSTSMELLAAEGPDPIRTEFRKVHTQLSLGGDLETVLRHLIARVPLVDVRFFVSAILLQRETGGNLSEILTSLGKNVRERMILKGQIRVATAHGRMTAMVLTLIPVFLVIFMLQNAPDQMAVFVEHPTGRLLGIWIIVSQVIGYLVIRKMIRFKV